MATAATSSSSDKLIARFFDGAKIRNENQVKGIIRTAVKLAAKDLGIDHNRVTWRGNFTPVENLQPLEVRQWLGYKAVNGALAS
jgi:hypothetical protein